MKSKELIEKAIRLSCKPEVIELLEQFLRANTVIKDIKFDLAKFVDKNSIYECAKGIYHKDGYKYVTDGHVLVSVKSEYDAAYEDKIISPTGEIIDTRFPKWKYALENLGFFSELKHQQPVHEICSIVKENEAVARVNGKKLILSICHEDTLTYFHSREFSLFLMFRKAYPDAVTYIRDNHCIYACDGENFCLIMCININSYYIENYSIIPLH